MKQVYKNIVIYELNGMCDEHDFGDIWHYGEVPENAFIPYSFEGASQRAGFNPNYSLFNNKLISLRLDSEIDSCINKRHFKSASIEYRFEVINLKMYSLSDLMNKLSVIEFLDWCKDNDINIVNLKGN